MATHSSSLAWRIPWTEEPGGLQSVGPQRVGIQLKQLSTHTQWVISELGTGYVPANKEDKILFSWSLFFNGMGR